MSETGLSETAPSSSLFWRFVLAGPLVFLVAVAVMGGAAVLIPPGPATINHVAIPLVIFPGVWAILFFYACLETRLWRCFLSLAVLALINSGLIAWHFWNTAQLAAVA